jgi:hypothetical protein
MLGKRFPGTQGGARYALKRYGSKTRQTGEDEWEHASMRLEPIKAEFEDFGLREGAAQLISEFVQVLE